MRMRRDAKRVVVVALHVAWAGAFVAVLRHHGWFGTPTLAMWGVAIVINIAWLVICAGRDAEQPRVRE